MRRRLKRSRRSIHAMNALLYCGLDVHRTGSSYAAIVDELGNVVQEKKMLSNDSILYR
ncbi:MAG: hypothetical protein JRN68_06730 [Nitrososphaerota archaeon]|jgi:hypothetical protein|nr:hypothetical protein [Nitrososphaerota archaeon]